MRDQIILQKLQQEEIIKHITITPQEITSFLNKKSKEKNIDLSQEYHLQDILIPLADTPSSKEIAAALKYAQEVVAQLNKGQNPAQMTLTTSRNHALLKVNDLGWRKLSEIPSLFVASVNRMQVNEITNPIQADNGFHVLRLVEARSIHLPKNVLSRKEAEAFLLQQKFEESMKTWIAKLRSQAFIITK